MKRLFFFLLSFSLFAPQQSARGAVADATPQGAPSVVRSLTLPNPVYAADAISTSLLVTWQAPESDGGADLVSYSVIAYKGGGYTTAEPGAICSPAHVSGTTNYSCTITGMNFATTYVIKATATNNINRTSTPVETAPFTTPSQPQTVTISPATTAPVTFGAGTTDLDATASSGLIVAWSTSTATICTVDNTGLVTYLGAGTCTVTATQDGSGSSFVSASASRNITVNPNLSAITTTATSITGTSATLQGTVPFSGASTAVTFCVSVTNSNATCGAPAGVTIGTASPATITANSSTSVSANVTGLSSGTTYYFWVEASASGSTAKGSAESFTTSIAPTVALSGPSSGEQNQAFNTSLTASSGSGVYTTWSASALPTGLALSPSGSTATISGTPTVVGSTSSIITVTDSAGQSGTLSVTFTITAPPPPPAQEDTTSGTSGDTNDGPTPTVETPEERIARELAEEAAKKAADEAALKKAEEERLAKEKAEQDEAARKKAEEERLAKEKADQEAAAKLESEKPGNINGIKEVADPVIDPVLNALPAPSPGNFRFVVNGTSTLAVLNIINRTTFDFTSGETKTQLTVRDPSGKLREVNSQQSMVIDRKDQILIKGSGLISGTKVTVWIFSTPTLLGKIDVKSTGEYEGFVALPTTFQLGKHTIQVSGIDKKNQIFALSIGVEVVDASTNPGTDSGSGKDTGTNTGGGTDSKDGASNSAGENGGESGSGVTKLVKFNRPILFAPRSTKLDSQERSLLKSYRKNLVGVKSLKCVGYTYAKKPTKREKQLARNQAKSVCNYLIGTRKITFTTSVLSAKSAPKVKRNSKSKTQRVDLQITRTSLPS